MKSSKLIFNLLLSATFLSFFAQLIIEFSTSNIAVACVILTSATITLLYLHFSNAFKKHPVSSFAIFGFLITSQLGAMLAQSLLLTAVSKDLRQPLATFSTLFLYQMIALCAHYFYRVLRTDANDHHSFIRSIFKSLQVYATPTIGQLWVMGFVGLFSALLSAIALFNGMQFLMWAPFLIPLFIMRHGIAFGNPKLHYPLVGIFFLLIAAFAISKNFKGLMLTGIVTIVMIFFLELLRNDYKVTRQHVTKAFITIVIGSVLLIPLAQIAQGMQAARAQMDRSKATTKEVFNKTLEAISNKQLYERYKKHLEKTELHSEYDEKYIDNLLLARFTETKFHDNTLYFANKMTESGIESVKKITIDFLLFGLPAPVLKWLKIDVDKDQIQYSMGDFIFHETIGTELGGYRTGSIFGQGMILFGSLFTIVYFLIVLALCFVKDLFCYQSADGQVQVSVIGLLIIWPTFLYGITAESLSYFVTGIFRGVPQYVILYFVVFYLSKSIVKLLDANNVNKNVSLYQ